MTELSEPLIWEETACGVCGNETFERVFEGPDRLENLPGRFQLVRCSGCGVFRQNPRLAWESLARYYPENYTGYGFEKPSNPLKERIIRYGPQKRLRAIEKHIARGKLLEVGCGSGGFLEQALLSGHWDVAGVEPNQTAAAYVREKRNIPVFNGLFSEAPFSAEEFDAVVMWCVLEHLSDPLEDLAHAHKVLKPNGWLFLSVPHYESVEARLFGEYWAGWDLPRHLFVFPKPQLRNMLNDAGFRVADEKCIAMSYGILGRSIDFWSQSWQNRHPTLQKLLVKMYYSWPTKAALVLPLAILDRLTRTSTLTVFAQKR